MSANIYKTTNPIRIDQAIQRGGCVVLYVEISTTIQVFSVQFTLFTLHWITNSNFFHVAKWMTPQDLGLVCGEDLRKPGEVRLHPEATGEWLKILRHCGILEYINILLYRSLKVTNPVAVVEASAIKFISES